MSAYRSRPAGAASEVAKPALSLLDDTERVEERFRDCFAVLVKGATVRRHLYLSLAAAERQVKRARARGAAASLVLVKLVPVDDRRLDGGAL